MLFTPWVALEDRKFVLSRPQEQAKRVLDPTSRCFFCGEKVEEGTEPCWLIKRQESECVAMLHAKCIVFPTRDCPASPAPGPAAAISLLACFRKRLLALEAGGRKPE